MVTGHELDILGVALTNPKAVGATRLTAADFDHPVHGMLWTTIQRIHADGLRPEPSLIFERLPMAARGYAAEVLVELPGRGIAGNVDAYTAAIRDRSERRRIAAALDGIQQRLANPETPAADIVAWAEQHLVGASSSLDQTADRLLTLDEFIDQPLPDLEWVLPGLLAVGERLVLTGTEGMGKTMLMRTIGVMAAAGLDPFSLRPIPAKRVLFVDCENPKRIMIEKFGDLRNVARTRGAGSGSMMVARYPQGLDLADPRDRLELHHACQLAQPELLLIGPAYKLYLGGSNAREEDLARLVTRTLDLLREEFGFALILEHHSPHAAQGTPTRSVRPIGSSLWLRWPEFGMGIRPASGTSPEDRQAEVARWRGDRDERDWPPELVGGGPGGVPWVDPRRMRLGASA